MTGKAKEQVLEIQVRSDSPKRALVTEYTWSRWTGRRFINNVEYHGDIAPIATGDPYTGARACPCAICQRLTEPQYRPDRMPVTEQIKPRRFF